MRLGSKCLGCAVLMLAIVATPLVPFPEIEASAAKREAKDATPAEEAKGPVQHPPGTPPVPITPKAMTTVAVPSILTQPQARYVLAPRAKTPGGPQPAEMPTPKQIRPRAKAVVDWDAVGSQAPAPPTLATPPLTATFDSVDFDSNITNAGFVFIPPDPSGAVGPSHAVSVTNVSLRFQDKATGATTSESSLGAFFAALSPLTPTFDPKVIYDQFAGRFVLVTLERTDVALGDAADTSRILVGVSDDADPNGTWYVTSVDASEVFFNPNVPPSGDSADHWVDYPGLAADEEVVYVTGNMFTFGTGIPGGVRLWVIDKGLGTGGLYDGVAAGVSRFDPYAGCGPGVDCFEITTQPAHVFGAAPTAPTNVGTWLVSYSGLSDGAGAGFDESVQVVRVDDPIGPGVTTFTQEFVAVGDIEDPFAAPLPEAEQLGIADTISTNDRRALQAVWRDNHKLYLSATILPESPDPDAGQATAHWFRLDTTSLAATTLVDQGNVGGEDIHPGGAVHTFFPSISVNDDDILAIGFSASSASIYAGSYYATRESFDPPGSIGASFTLRAGLAPYLRTFCQGPNRWGDYSGMSVDPVDQCFWVYNGHALSTGSPTTATCQVAGNEVGRWGTAFGKFCGRVCGDGTVSPDEGCDPPGDPAGAHGNDCRADCTVCGDGVVDAVEVCDDGNAIETDTCRNDCTPTICGDGIVGTGEVCDDGNLVDGDGCESDCTPTPICGDGLINVAGETCDPPAVPAGANGNDCRADCTVCGDGVVDTGETCDDGNATDTDGCRNDCTVPVCGDGIVDAGETCDDGNLVDGDGCESDCTPTPVCGDGQLNLPGETCDPPGGPGGANGNDCRADCTVCGDGVVDAGESCDDGNTTDDDSCRNDCTIPVCGDAILDPGETCDPPGQPAGANANDCRADCTVCGDGAPNAGESCDDGNTIDDDACRNDCTVPVCGDGILDTGETCDPPGQPAGANGNDCRGDCTVCGDGAVDAGEDCDDGNTTDTDTCRNDCTIPVCGDGIVDSGEACDDANMVDGDGCENDCTVTPVCGDDEVNAPGETCDPPGVPGGASGNTCRGDCTVCGDGVLDVGETCDDGNADGDDACRNDCTIPVCGDTIVDAGEDCDDGNTVAGDGCENDCTATPVCGDGEINVTGETCDPPGAPGGASGNDCRVDCTVCGDGVLDAGEDCDDGNASSDDTCRNDCTIPVCGDTIVDAGEDCDDGNAVAGDGCENDCTATPACGDGEINVAGETCDPPGAPAGAAFNNCREDCTVCGDGVLDPGEECDDGNSIGTDGCRNNCTAPPHCGDGLINVAGETCDPPGSPAGTSGNDCRADCTVCGDLIVDPVEDCDDGNTVDGDGCETDCTTTPVCGDGAVNAPGETCDPPASPGGVNGNTCRGDCTVCGDGVVDAGEQCDDGNTIGNDDCRNNCTAPVCGDGFVDSGEGCDPPGEPAGPHGYDCRADCSVCGDGVVDLGEACDDGNAFDTDTCRNDCTAPECGDGILDAGEDCDDGNLVDGDGCESDCTPTPECGDGQINATGETCDPPGAPGGASGNDCRADCTVCGDGVTDAGETCDDGNATNTDSCRNDCTAPACGDGIVDTGEDCDDGNLVDGDGCEGDCTPTPECGDGAINVAGETCDPPGNPAGANGNVCRADCTVCGDGIVDQGEDCDDGNVNNIDGCRNDCVQAVCGDGDLDPGETCDPPGEPAGVNGNDCRVDCKVCGDGIVDPGEDCDDANTNDFDSCRNDCSAPRCGDGILDSGENCEPPGLPAGAVGNSCRADCTVCGDGTVDAAEECDDGNANDLDACRNDCFVPACGDGIVDPGEECDDGNTVDGDGCDSDCTPTAFCGDDLVNAAGETCDPPGAPAGASGNDCRADCTVCGDGVVDPGEQCDDGNADNADACRNDCVSPNCGDGNIDPGETCDPPGQPGGAISNDCREDCTVCGDGIVNGVEECDDGNAFNFDACRNNCVAAVCGDGIVDADEDCDDGNTTDGDGCESDCTETPFCGDGDVDPGETCDPPGQPGGATGNVCRGDCTVCGDGVVDAGEECDDGNAENADGCHNDCLLPQCGDGIVDAPDETCDPPGQPAGATGNVCRADCSVCGDGVVDAGEQCDDGNTENDDGCRNSCLFSLCGNGTVDPPQETCDPPDQPAGANGNDCRDDCTVCGDGIVDPGEECDDGNTFNVDQCRNDCVIPFCGDGFLKPSNEECDDGNNTSGDGCEANCVFTPSGTLTTLIFSRVPGEPEITLSWGPSCLVSDTDYAIYEGTFPNFATHLPRTCSTGGSQTVTFEPATYSTYYLLVPRNENVEGSYGEDSDGNERAASTAACERRRLGVCD